MTLETPAAPAALATLFRAVGPWVKLRPGLFTGWRVPGATSCSAREQGPWGLGSLVMRWVPSANVPFTVLVVACRDPTRLLLPLIAEEQLSGAAGGVRRRYNQRLGSARASLPPCSAQARSRVADTN